MVVVVGSAGGVGAATVAVVSNPGPGLPGEVVGVTSLTDTLIGPKSFLDGSFKEIDSFDHCYYHPSRQLIIRYRIKCFSTLLPNSDYHPFRDLIL